MALECIDFTYLGRKLSQLSAPYCSVDFEQDPETAFALSRTIDYGETNRQRTEPNIHYSGLKDHLTFELHLAKDPAVCSSPSEAELTESEVRELTRWLTSTDTSQFLELYYEPGREENTRIFYGQFTEVKPFNVSGMLYGLYLTFECSCPYGYSPLITHTAVSRNQVTSLVIDSKDDRLLDFCRPSIRMDPRQTGQAWLCNLSDCHIMEQGTLPGTATSPSAPELLLEQLKEQVGDYALAHGLAVRFRTLEDDTAFTVCGTAIPVHFTDPQGIRTKGMAFYLQDSLQYYIIEGGFLYLNVQKDLGITIDSEKLFFRDDLDRMVRFSSIGIDDVDYIYWPRLKSGENHLLFQAADCTFIVTHRETRKVGV